MYVHEVIDHQTGKIVGIYKSLNAATSKVINLCGQANSSRYRIWPNYVNEVIYEADLDCVYQEDTRAQDQYEEYDPTNINAVPF